MPFSKPRKDVAAASKLAEHLFSRFASAGGLDDGIKGTSIAQKVACSAPCFAAKSSQVRACCFAIRSASSRESCHRRSICGAGVGAACSRCAISVSIRLRAACRFSTSARCTMKRRCAASRSPLIAANFKRRRRVVLGAAMHRSCSCSWFGGGPRTMLGMHTDQNTTPFCFSAHHCLVRAQGKCARSQCQRTDLSS